MIDITKLINELNKVDIELGLPQGTTAAAIAYHKQDAIIALNDKIKNHGIIINIDGTVDNDYQPAWQDLMNKLGVSKAWWLTNDPSLPLAPGSIHII